jgi:hypothetical protein
MVPYFEQFLLNMVIRPALFPLQGKLSTLAARIAVAVPAWAAVPGRAAVALAGMTAAPVMTLSAAAAMMSRASRFMNPPPSQ